MTAFPTRPEILEVTLRDGSYLIDFQFTAHDTALIASALESVGFRWIEVGHGLGLNASASGKGAAAATDEEYLAAAAESLSAARWGMFFIPGIGREQDILLAGRYRMHFIRIGTNINEIREAERYIKLAKDQGMIVSYNGMKSYAVSAPEWGRNAALAAEWGADIVCLVDSAGSMYPDEVSAYLGAAKSHCEVALGFHGHDNLALSMANTLRAIDEGATLVDASLQGMGRSAGNAITEVLVAILKKRGMLADVDMKAVMDIGNGLIRPLLGRRGVDPMAVTGGFAKFHSSFTPKVLKYAQKHGIDVRDLIVKLCEEDLISAPDDLLERIGRDLARAKMPQILSIPTLQVGGKGAVAGLAALEALTRELRPQAIKAGKFSALNVVIGESPQSEFRVSGNIQSTQAHVAGSITYTDEGQLVEILTAIDGKVDVVFLDVDRKPFGPGEPATTASRVLQKSALLTYLDSRIWAAAVEDQIVRLLSENLEGVPAVICGDHPKSRLLATNLFERRADVSLIAASPGASTEGLAEFTFASGPGVRRLQAGSPAAQEAICRARVVVIWASSPPLFGVNEATMLHTETCVVDAAMRAFGPDVLEALHARQALLVRLDMWPAIAGALIAAHESQRVSRECMGWGRLAGVPVVAGGAMGVKGDVIVDNIREPSRVIGIADGKGGVAFQYTAEEADRVRRVTAEIQSRLVMPHLTTAI